MLTTNDLLDLAKTRLGVSTDYQLAKILGVRQANISAYRNLKSCPDAPMCRRLAEVIDMDPDVVLCHVNAERTKDEETAVQWRRIASRLMGAATAATVILSVAFFGAPKPADAAIADDCADGPATHLAAH